MIHISPYHPELEAIWQALSATGARSIAVIAAEPGEGTSLIASALARRASLAAVNDIMVQDAEFRAANRMALLVDLDVERPSTARMFDLHPQPDKIVRSDARRSFQASRDSGGNGKQLPDRRRIGSQNNAMTIGVLADIGKHTSQIWRERARLVEQLTAWRSEWSVVVLDSAPLLTGDTDTIPGTTAAAAADACVLVTLAGRTPGNRIREACARLTDSGANLIGAILNDRDNPSLLAELTKETRRFDRVFPRSMAALRVRMQRSPVLTARI